jgi:hypothetical protein
VVWLANLTARPQQIEISDLEGAEMAVLDAETFVAASRDPGFLDQPAAKRLGRSMTLSPYAVLRLRGN